MRFSGPPKVLMSSAVAFTCAVVSPASAQDEQVMVDVRFAGLANVEPHAKDAAAHKAFMMMGDRLVEVPGEVGGPEQASEIVDMVWDLIRGANSLRIVQLQKAPGLGLAYTIAPEQPYTGESYLDRVASFVMQAGGPIEEAENGYTLMTPIGPASLTSGDVGGRSAATLRLATESTAETTVQKFDLPDDATVDFSAQVHLRQIGNVAAQIASRRNPEIRQLIEEYPWVINEAPVINVACGQTSTYRILTARLVGGKNWLTQLGMNSDDGFTEDDFSVIPMDATKVSAFPFDLGLLLQISDNVFERIGGTEPYAELEEIFGVDVRSDVLENIGPRMMYYQSDATGGGGLMSSVLITELHDPERLANAHRQIVERTNELAADEARGYVQIRSWDLDGQTIFSLATPGLPVPIEPSWTIVGDRLVVAASPVGLSVAVRQIGSEGMSINDNSDFREVILKQLPEGGASAIAFSDAARYAKMGYGGTNLLLSGLANAVRSPSDPSREPGVLMPDFGAFAAGIHPTGAIKYWDGDDFVTVMRSDASSVVNMAAMLGQMGGLKGVIALTAMQIGSVMPKIEQANLEGKTLKSASRVRGLVQAAILYANDNDGNIPASYAELADLGYIDWEMLSSPAGPSYDGLGDIVLRSDFEDGKYPDYSADIVVAIDRAAYVNGGMDVNMGFADGHVERLGHWEVDEILERPENEGARETFKLDSE